MKKGRFLIQAVNFVAVFFERILIFFSIGGWIILLISAFSDRVSPFKCSYIPFFGLFFPFILAFNLLFLIIWFLFQKKIQVIATLIVLAVCWDSIRTYFPIHNRTKNIPNNCIKMLTYNVMRFGNPVLHTSDNPNPIIQYVIEQDPDIVCFQEYTTVFPLTDHIIRKALKTTPYYKLHPPELAIFSKYPILSVKEISIGSHYNGSMLVELNIKGRKVTLVNNHLESNKLSPDERTDYYDMIKDINTQKIENFIHIMFHRLEPAFRQRAEQMKTIIANIRENRNPYIIVCGDFNDTPISYTCHLIKYDLTDAFVESGLGMGISYNRYCFLFRIDYIFHSKNMKAYNCTVGKLKTSDHYPVWTYLQFLD